MIVRITASRHTAFYSPLICTMAAGFLEKHGAEFTYGVLKPGETAAMMIRENKTDVMQTAPSTNWARMDKGETDFPLNFALINQRDGFFLLGRNGNFAWKDLEGKTLIADHGSQPLTMLRYAIQYNGVDLTKVEMLNAGSPAQMATAFREGKGDFVHFQAPAPDLPARSVTSVGASMPPNAFSTLCASREFIKTDLFRLFTRAFAEAKDWVRQASAEEVAAKEASYFPGVAEPVLAAAIAQYQTIGAWSGGIEIPRDLYEQSLNIFESTGAIKQRHPYDAVCFSGRIESDL